MIRNIKLFLIFTLITVFFLPQDAFSGEYDGIWTGSEKAYWGDELILTLEDVNIIIYHQDENSLYSYDASIGEIYLVRSGNNWILDSSIETTFEGDPVIIDSMTLTFTSSTTLTGSFSFRMETEGTWFYFTVTIDASKRVITSLSNGVAITNLSGSIDSYSYFQIDIPQDSTNLTVTTYGGTGDCDLSVLYYKPDFNLYWSENDDNNEAVNAYFPQPGRYYVVLYGWDSYSGVTLLATYDEAPVADFTASPTRGRVPFDVNFTDQSEGSITSWSWDFGDGTTSTEQNPTHTYDSPGTYTVQLTVMGPDGADTEEKKDLISGYQSNGAPWINLLLLDE
jgi:hypothetical protein